MTRLQEELSKAAAELGLEINLNLKIRLESGRELVALAHLPKLGAPNGMIIVTSFDEIRDLVKELANSNYAYSVLSEPDSREAYDFESYVELFSDWGWAGAEGNRPRRIKLISSR